MYTPKLPDNLIRELYYQKQIQKRPMTKIAAEAIAEYLERRGAILNQNKNKEMIYGINREIKNIHRRIA